MDWYADFLKKMFAANSILTTTEKKEIFEAFALKVYVTWEILMQNLLVDCLNRNTSQYARYKDCELPAHLPRNVCESLIAGLGYFNPTDTANIVGIAKNILVPRYNPFGEILKADLKEDREKIDQFRHIRNYLAHYSNSSKRKLLSMYRSKYSLKNFREPGNFLSATDKKTNRVRFLNYTKAFFNAADAMADFLYGKDPA